MTWIQILQTYLEKIASIATEENYGELTKLVDFSIVYYEKELAYYDHLRDDLEIMARGYHVLNSKYQDIRELDKHFLKLSTFLAKATYIGKKFERLKVLWAGGLGV